MKRLATTRYSVSVARPQLAAGCARIAFLTDLHGCCAEDEANAIRDVLSAEKPDAVLIGGDMLYAKAGEDAEAVGRFVGSLAEKYPVWAANGNHEARARRNPEYYGNLYEVYKYQLEESNAKLLVNGCDCVVVGSLPVSICGYEMDLAFYRRFHKAPPLPVKELQRAVGEPDPLAYTILLAHDPAQMDSYYAWGADLTLCGHYHGGIVRLGKHRGLISPEMRPFPAKAYGRFDRGEQAVIVGAGLGEHPVPVRVRNPREVVIVDIISQGTEQKDIENGY